MAVRASPTTSEIIDVVGASPITWDGGLSASRRWMRVSAVGLGCTAVS
jgi:hypothetical protein